MNRHQTSRIGLQLCQARKRAARHCQLSSDVADGIDGDELSKNRYEKAINTGQGMPLGENHCCLK